MPDVRPDETRFGAGGFPFRGPYGVSYSANLTPDPQTGIGTWGDGTLIASLYGARRAGGRVLPPMPSPYYAAGIAEEDLKALLAYLRTLKPIRNAVPPPEPPKNRYHRDIAAAACATIPPREDERTRAQKGR